MTDSKLLTSNSADILLNLVSIAKKYNLDITKDTFLRTGNFAYLTEMGSKIIQNSILSKQIESNELFASTAINPESLVQLCRSFNIDVTQAEPAYGTLELTINLNDATNQQYILTEKSSGLEERYGEEISSFPVPNAIIIDRGTKFQAGSINFYLERSIIIWMDSLTGRWVAKYITTENKRTEFQSLSTNYLETRIRIHNGVSYLTVFPRVYQFDVQTLQRLIHKSEIVYTSVINFAYEDNYIGARLFYNLNNSRNVNRTEIPLSTNLINKDPFIEAIGGKLSIAFPNSLDSFKPSANSVLTLETYTSKGNAGNLTYSKPLSVIHNEKATHKYQMVAYLKNGLSYGGADEPTIDQLRDLFINQVSSRNIIATSSDLNLYFSRLKNLISTISNSDVLFIKKRDDILKRYYDAFLLFRDNKNYSVDTTNGDASSYNNVVDSGYLSSVIPTYTFERVRFNESFASQSIKFGHNVLAPNSNEETAAFVSGSNNKDAYMVPFYIHVTTNPINSVHYIFNRTNEVSPLTLLDRGTGSSIWTMPTEVSIERTAVNQDYYTLKFNFETINSIRAGDYKYKLSIFQVGNSLLKSNIELQKVAVTNREYRNESTDEDINYVQIESKIYVDKDDEFKFGDTISQNLILDGEPKQVFSQVKFKIEVFDNSDNNLQIAAESDYVTLFIDLQDVMYSDIKINVNEANNLIDSIDIYDVPVVHSSYLNGNNDISFFVDQMFTFIDLLKESQRNIDQSEMINIKFYRSYGVSELYSTTKTNLDLRLDIMSKLTNISEAKALVDAIRVFVDSYNVNKIFRYSDLVTDIMNSDLGNYIYNINFRGLNGTWEQTVDYIGDDSIYYPEYFNIVGDAMKNIRVFYYDPRSKDKRLILGE